MNKEMERLNLSRKRMILYFAFSYFISVDVAF